MHFITSQYHGQWAPGQETSRLSKAQAYFFANRVRHQSATAALQQAPTWLHRCCNLRLFLSAHLKLRKSLETGPAVCDATCPGFFLRRFRDPILVPRISNRVPRIRENYHQVPKIRENRVPANPYGVPYIFLKRNCTCCFFTLSFQHCNTYITLNEHIASRQTMAGKFEVGHLISWSKTVEI